MVTGLLFWGKGEESEKQQLLEIEPRAPGLIQSSQSQQSAATQYICHQNSNSSFSSGCSKRMCLNFDPNNDVQAYPAGGTAYNIVTGPHLVLVVVALKVAYMVQVLELDHLQQEIQN